MTNRTWNDDMIRKDPIDRDVLDAYRDEGAPPGFAIRVRRGVRQRSQSPVRLRLWALPAAAVVVGAVMLWKSDERSTAPNPRVALSFSRVPAGLPTMSDVDSLRVPSLAALGVKPTRPVLDLPMPAFHRIKSSNQTSTAPTTRPN